MRILWKAAGSYGLGIVLMMILLVLTFYGTLFQVRYADGGNMTQAAEAFFGSSWVLIPLGGENALIALPLPGMWVVCFLLFINLLIGGIVKARKDVSRWGILLAHAGVLFLFASIALGHWRTQVVEEINLVQGEGQYVVPLGMKLQLQKFTPVFYPGTTKPKSFESELTISKDGVESAPMHIRMNEPLRIHGWTLYQMSWGQAGRGDQMVSVLRASHNPFEQGPKWASYIISAGLFIHFSMMFVRYLGERRGKEILEKKEIETIIGLSLKKRLIICGIGVFILSVFGIGMMAAKPPVEITNVDGYIPWDKAFISRFSRVAVQDGGRLKPFSTYSGFAMLRSLGKRQLTIASEGEKIRISPTEWALDCMFRPEYARQFPVFLVNRDEVVSRLGLPSLGEKRKRYSFALLEPRLHEIYSQGSKAEGKGDVEKDLSSLAQNVRQVELWMSMPVLAVTHRDSLSMQGNPRWFRVSADEWTSEPSEKEGRVFAEAWIAARKGISSHSRRQNEEFLKTAQDLLEKRFIEQNWRDSAGDQHLFGVEQEYYRLDPLYLAMGCFVGGFIFSLLGVLVSPMKKAGWQGTCLQLISGRGVGLAWFAGVAGSLVLLYGMIMRFFITFRSPVGNTYETIAFIACSGVIVALVMEAIGKRGVLLAGGLVLGFFACQMGVMYEAGQASDHMDPLVAILRSNFLLSTHVITIVLGYAAGLLAAILSQIHLLSDFCRLLDGKTKHMLTRMAYGALCFSLLFTLVGTVFGGIWGNEAWGRFWGWDPKENGALMIVLWQLIILHARLGGYIKDWGLHFGNMCGGVMIAFAWWGVNTLGVGLHSYGFSQGRDSLHLFYLIEGGLMLLLIMSKIRRRNA